MKKAQAGPHNSSVEMSRLAAQAKAISRQLPNDVL